MISIYANDIEEEHTLLWIVGPLTAVLRIQNFT